MPPAPPLSFPSVTDRVAELDPRHLWHPFTQHQGWIEAEWAVSELGRRAKYYRLTASGRRQLTVEAREWERMAAAIGRAARRGCRRAPRPAAATIAISR